MTQEQKPIKKMVAPKLPPKLTYFDVRVETLLPATLTFRILAEDAKQAAEMIKGRSPNSVAHRLIGRKDIQLKVYDAGCSIIHWAKKLTGL